MTNKYLIFTLSTGRQYQIAVDGEGLAINYPGGSIVVKPDDIQLTAVQDLLANGSTRVTVGNKITFATDALIAVETYEEVVFTPEEVEITA